MSAKKPPPSKRATANKPAAATPPITAPPNASLENSSVVPMASLRPTPHNVRVHPEAQLKEFERSLLMFGQFRPLVVDEAGVIWAGNGLFAAMQRLGWTSAWVLEQRGMSEQKKKKLMLSDNKLYELGQNATTDLLGLLKTLDDFDVPGFDEEVLFALAADPGTIDALLTGYGNDARPGSDIEVDTPRCAACGQPIKSGAMV